MSGSAPSSGNRSRVVVRVEPGWFGCRCCGADEVVGAWRRCGLSIGCSQVILDGIEHCEQECEPTITVLKDSPYPVTGGIQLPNEPRVEAASTEQYALCRCGGSKKKSRSAMAATGTTPSATTRTDADPRSATDAVRGFYDRAASGYDGAIRLFERLLLGNARAWAASQAHGQVLEIGVGTGRNLAYYPAQVQLVGVDLSPAMLAIARRRAQQLGRPVDLRPADAEHLPFADASFDTMLATLVLCSVPDERRAIAEAARVLRPGGRLVLVEHVRSPRLAVRLVQRALDPLMVRFEHDHLLRDPVDVLASAGFAVEMCERAKWGIVERLVAQKKSKGLRPEREV